jgi:hypothetical protein
VHNHFSRHSPTTSIHLNPSWPLWPCLITQICLPNCFLLKLLCPPSNCAYINTFIPIHCLHMAMNVSGRNFVCSQELENNMFAPHILTTFRSDWHCTKVMDSCGFKVTCGGERMSCDCVELVFVQLHYCNWKIRHRSQNFSASPLKILTQCVR